MKKKFIAPVVETKEFNSPEDVMIGAMLTSAGQANENSVVIDDAAVDGFKAWKGIK